MCLFWDVGSVLNGGETKSLFKVCAIENANTVFGDIFFLDGPYAPHAVCHSRGRDGLDTCSSAYKGLMEWMTTLVSLE